MWNLPLKMKSGLTSLTLKKSDLDNILPHLNHPHRHYQEEIRKHDSDLGQFQLPPLCLSPNNITLEITRSHPR